MTKGQRKRGTVRGGLAKRVLNRHEKALAVSAPAEECALDVARAAEILWTNAIAGEHRAARKLVRTDLDGIKTSLLGQSPTPLERLLVDRIAVCWLQVQHADGSYVAELGKAPLELGDYLQRRQDRAHKRYLGALKALAQVRRLLSPAVQINVAENQVVANTSISAEGLEFSVPDDKRRPS